MNKRLEKILSQVIPNTGLAGRPPTCTLWYSGKHGTIYGIGDGRPLDSLDNPKVRSVKILWDRYGAVPKVHSEAKVTGALQTALNTIKMYRDEKSYPNNSI